MKLGQLLECNMRNIFPQKSYTKCSAETIPRPFSKKSKFSISMAGPFRKFSTDVWQNGHINTVKDTLMQISKFCQYLCLYMKLIY